jgi:hypothetical protein
MSKFDSDPNRRPELPDVETATEAAPERRGDRRVRLSLDTAVPVQVRAHDDDGLRWGVARNISEGGILIELREPLALGTEVDVRLIGLGGAEEEIEPLRGVVRHSVNWSHGAGPRLYAAGVQFVTEAPVWDEPWRVVPASTRWLH